MPIYGYRCKICGYEFEVTQSVNDEPVKQCPECDEEVAKIFYPVGIAFKGSGFYVTDNRKETSAPANAGTAKESAPNPSGSNSGNGSGCAGCAKSSTCEKSS